MSSELCHECRPYNACRYKTFIEDTFKGARDASSPNETRDALSAIAYLIDRAGTKSDPCPRVDELREIGRGISTVLYKEHRQESESSAK